VKGIVDLVDQQFYGTDENEEDFELLEDLERTVGIRETVSTGRWKNEYEGGISPPIISDSNFAQNDRYWQNLNRK
jgi:hypothetical protein